MPRSRTFTWRFWLLRPVNVSPSEIETNLPCSASVEPVRARRRRAVVGRGWMGSIYATAKARPSLECRLPN